ncbi:MAG: hypothetical protein V4555_00145 [Acidobacteriota bacterium]
MKTAAKICLVVTLVACLCLAGFILHGPKEKETWSTLTGVLAVIAAGIAVLPALRILEIQEDALRPRPTPYFDLTSRYDLLQLRVKNLGGGVAYDVRLHWKHRPTDHMGNPVVSLDRIATLLPQESVSTLVGVSSTIVRELSDSRFEGVCRCKDASGRTHRATFVCSLDANQKQLLHDNELPKTLRELQDIPKELSRIADLLESYRPKS